MSLFDDYVSALSEELGIALEPEYSCLDIEVDELTIHLLYDEDGATVTGSTVVYDLGDQPSPEQQAALAIRSLEGQYCFAQTAGFTLGLSGDDRCLLLQGRWTLGGISPRQFIDSLETFVQAGRLAMIFLKEATKESRTEEPEDIVRPLEAMVRV